MQCTFLNAAGTTLFTRDDMESGHWVQEQMNMTADFTFDPDKVIQFGQRIAFRDPATDTIQVFEIINVSNQEPDHYQQITAEHIVIAELSDEHINTTQIDSKTASQALTTALSGTLWSVGTDTSSGSQSADISRGSVWDAVNTIQQNWNVYITPRVVISSAGVITNRYLDISPAEGTWRGLRLSFRKNMIDPVVTYDESEVYTALYGYGGNIEVAQASGDDQTQELTFADEVWSATSSHPAKPSGQTYLEWPEKTALYGRNGRPRYGYYQNGNIKSASLLLEKTWESLKQSCEPKISISGTCVDLYRLGYKDQPLRLHDQVVVEIEETGEQFYKQITCLDVDLIDPTGSRAEIGDYIQNIVYINRETNKKASGGGGGGGGSKGSMTELEDTNSKFSSDFIKTNQQIGMVVGIKDGATYVKAAQIVASINDDGGTNIKLEADTIDIDGIVDALTTYDVTTNTLTTDNTAHFGGEVQFDEGANFNNSDVDGIVNLTADNGAFDDVDTVTLEVSGTSTLADVSCSTLSASSNSTLSGVSCSSLTVPNSSLTVGSDAVSWQSYTARYVEVSSLWYFLRAATNSTTPTGTTLGRVITDSTNTTIHYLGKAST